VSYPIRCLKENTSNPKQQQGRQTGENFHKTQVDTNQGMKTHSSYKVTSTYNSPLLRVTVDRPANLYKDE